MKRVVGHRQAVALERMEARELLSGAAASTMAGLMHRDGPGPATYAPRWAAAHARHQPVAPNLYYGKNNKTSGGGSTTTTPTPTPTGTTAVGGVSVSVRSMTSFNELYLAGTTGNDSITVTQSGTT